MKRLFYLFLLSFIAFVYVLPGSVALAEEPVDAERAAMELFELGLLHGTGQGFALDAACDRAQAAALFTRLLGREEDALANLRPHPFRDIKADNWAAPYIAYLYSQGLAYGVDYNEFGLGPLLAQQFATFCLRALDYTEGNLASDFQWGGALDFMVQKHIISGNLRNRLTAATHCRRSDAVLLSYATLAAEVKEGGQTLFERLLEQGAISFGQAAVFLGQSYDLRFAYPTGLLDADLLTELAIEQGLSIYLYPYEALAHNEEEIYRQLRKSGQSFDISVLPGHIIDNLRDDALLQPLNISDFGGKNAIIAQLRDDPHWFDADNRRYWALPLACELPLLYYDSTRVQDPDWGFLFRLAYSGSIYLPASPSTLIPLFLHYYNLPYDYVEDNRLQEVLKHLSGQSGLTPAYLDQHMLDIPEWAGAALGVISSRDLPELKRRQEENPAYANWRAILPPSGAPMKVYYAALNKNGNSKAAAGFLAALTQPATMAAHTRIGGYLPTMREAQRLLSSTFPISFGERCRPLHINQQNQMLYEQIYRNVLLYEAQQTSQPIIDSLEFTFTRDGRVYRSCMIDLAHMQATVTWPSEQESGSGLQQQITVKLRYDQAKACAKELTRLGVALWKEYYDGASDNASWELRMIFANGDERICQGFGSPPLWLDLATALLSYSGVDLLPTML